MYVATPAEVKTRVKGKRKSGKGEGERSKSSVAWHHRRPWNYMGRGGQRTITLYLSRVAYS